MNFYVCDYDEGPCVLSERAVERMKQDPARCVAHGAIIGDIIRNVTDREAARAQVRPFKPLYRRSNPKR